MPAISVVIYCDADGTTPMLKWMDGLMPKAQVKCLARIERLQVLGYELRRPEADYLRDHIHELRADLQGIHYRILYFFHGQNIAVLSHGIVKERRIPPNEIALAIKRRRAFIKNPELHTYTEATEHGNEA